MDRIVSKGGHEALTERLVSCWKAYGHYSKMVVVEEDEEHAQNELQMHIQRGYFTDNTISEMVVLNRLYDFCPGFVSKETTALLLGKEAAATAPALASAPTSAKKETKRPAESQVEEMPKWMHGYDQIVLFLVRAKMVPRTRARLTSGPDRGTLVSVAAASPAPALAPAVVPAPASAAVPAPATGTGTGTGTGTDKLAVTATPAGIPLTGQLDVFKTAMAPVFRAALAQCKNEVQRNALYNTVYKEIESKLMLDMLLDSKSNGSVVGFALCHMDGATNTFCVGRVFVAPPYDRQPQLLSAVRQLHDQFAQDQACSKVVVYMPRGGNKRTRSALTALYDRMYGSSYAPFKSMGLEAADVAAITHMLLRARLESAPTTGPSATSKRKSATEELVYVHMLADLAKKRSVPS